MWELDQSLMNMLFWLTVTGVGWLLFGDRILDRIARARRRIKRHAH